MIIGLTGASGFIGKRIVSLAGERGHAVVAFSRHPEKTICGCVETRRFSFEEKPDVNGCDALIHLAGENIFGLWTPAKKRRILSSRELGTRALVDGILAAQNPPRVLVSGSAIGFYGDTGENVTNESAPPGEGFLADVSQKWEDQAERAKQAGVRVVLLRTAVVLGSEGGALGAMRPIFRAGLGGKMGSGRQWMSWIHLEDEAALALFAAENENVHGALNAGAPEPVLNADFTRALAREWRRPAIFTVPAFILRLFTGEFSRELLDSKRIVPRAALAAGFVFRFPKLREALADLIHG